MGEVRIYIETSLRGPCLRDGWYAAVIECQTKKGPATAGLVGMERETTYYRSTLLAIVKAMKKLNRPCTVVIHTYCQFVKGIFEQGLLESWHREEWRKSSGEEVENRELWRQFFDEAKRMGGTDKITFQYSKSNVYRDLMRRMIEEDRKRARI